MTAARTAARRAWAAMGTAMMVRIITAGMLVYALVIGGLFAGYTRLQGCVATYADQSARRTAEISTATSRSAKAQIDVARAMQTAGSVADLRAAAAELERALIEQEQLRDSNPPPLPPTERCD